MVSPWPTCCCFPCLVPPCEPVVDWRSHTTRKRKSLLRYLRRVSGWVIGGRIILSGDREEVPWSYFCERIRQGGFLFFFSPRDSLSPVNSHAHTGHGSGGKYEQKNRQTKKMRGKKRAKMKKRLAHRQRKLEGE